MCVKLSSLFYSKMKVC